MAFLVGWLGGSALVAWLAWNWKARSPFGFGFLSVITSPLIGFIVLLFFENRKAQQMKMEQSAWFNLEQLQEQLKGLHSLAESQVYSQEEMQKRKMVLLEQSVGKRFDGNEEDFMLQMVKLVQAQLVTKDELQHIRDLWRDRRKQGQIAS